MWTKISLPKSGTDLQFETEFRVAQTNFFQRDSVIKWGGHAPESRDTQMCLLTWSPGNSVHTSCWDVPFPSFQREDGSYSESHVSKEPSSFVNIIGAARNPLLGPSEHTAPPKPFLPSPVPLWAQWNWGRQTSSVWSKHEILCLFAICLITKDWVLLGPSVIDFIRI